MLSIIREAVMILGRRGENRTEAGADGQKKFGGKAIEIGYQI